MAKYKSSAAYRAADTLNKQIKAIYSAFGENSETYKLYVNKLTALLPAGSIHVSRGGFIQVSKGKSSGLTAQQIKFAKKGLSSVNRAKSSYKRQIASQRLAEKGNLAPTESQIQREAKGISTEDVRKYVDAKSKVKEYEDSRHKLKYDASVTDLMGTLGPKSYELLAAILEEGEKRSNAEAQEETATANRVEASYQANKAKLAD